MTKDVQVILAAGWRMDNMSPKVPQTQATQGSVILPQLLSSSDNMVYSVCDKNLCFVETGSFQ